MLLYCGLAAGAVAFFVGLRHPWVGWLAVAMSASVIGVHGVLSGTASMDFGGRRNVGVAVGIIDAFVYMGTASQALLFGRLLPDGERAQDPSQWAAWPAVMLAVALLGLLLGMRLWNARPARAVTLSTRTLQEEP
jgi:OPA family glycerol-3-phosphate transporter-like MFS transporter